MTITRLVSTFALVATLALGMVQAGDAAKSTMPDSLKGSWVLDVGATQKAMKADKAFSQKKTAEASFLLTMYSKMEYRFLPGKLLLVNHGRRVELGQTTELPLNLKSATESKIVFDLVRKHGNGTLITAMKGDRMIIDIDKSDVLSVMVWMRKPKDWKPGEATKAAPESKKAATTKKATPAAKETNEPSWTFSKIQKAIRFQEHATNKNLADACTAHPETERLSFWNNKKITTLAPVAKLTNLKRLELSSLAEKKRIDLTPLATLTKLEDLDCYATRVSNTNALKGLAALKKVSLYMSAVDSIDFVAHLPNLEELSLYGFQHTFKDYKPLVGLKKLRKLNIYMNTTATDDLLAPLEALTSLEELRSSNNRGITHFGFLKNCKNLMSINNNWGSVKDLSALKGMKNLQVLQIDRCPVTDLTPLAGMTKLRSLDIDESKVTDLSPLATCTELGELEISKIPAKDLSPLKACTKLTRLKVSKDMPQAQIDALKKALPKLEVETR